MGKRSSCETNGQHNYGPLNKRTKYNQINGLVNGISDEETTINTDFQLTRELVNGAILTDLARKQWRIGKPIGKGNFGEIFLASDNITVPVTNDNARYVIKIEPHSNGPLFVEIHCLLNTAKNSEENPLPPGMPEYIASGSHYFKNTRYRFLVLQRFDRDLHSVIKNRRVSQKSILVLAIQILDILQHLHDKGYCHSDIKAENLMIGKYTFKKNQNEDYTMCSSSEEFDDSENELYDEENSNQSFMTPQLQKITSTIQFSGSNPVRSCRSNKRCSIYQEMVKKHYLRPTKNISYTEFFNDENSKSEKEDDTIDDFIYRSRSNSSRGDKKHSRNNYITEDRIFLIDFGLASKFIDSTGAHRPFCMDQRRAHDGTLEFTSRDAHMGAHSRRSDLECLGYNLIYWSQGYLPWKEIAMQNQHEKVHWMKEYLMTNVIEMLRHIYGKAVPRYLGEYMSYIGNLAYNERPNYEKCKRIFKKEFIRLGYKKEEMLLDMKDLCKKIADVEEIENNNIFEMKNVKSAMKNLGIILPFHETTGNRVSPKNLRSKSEKSKKKHKKFSWAEILSQDPDQIARERAEKEFERDLSIETPIKYEGKPTYAIKQIENKLKFKDRINAVDEQEDILIKGYTRPMMEIYKKRESLKLSNTEMKKEKSKPITRVSKLRNKAGLRTIITPTKRGLDYNNEIEQKRRTKRTHKNSGDFTSDESSCSSINSVATTVSNTKKTQGCISTSSSLRGGATSSTSCNSELSDEDTRDVMIFSPKKTRYSANKLASDNTLPKRKRGTPRKRQDAKVKRKKVITSDEDEVEDICYFNKVDCLGSQNVEAKVLYNLKRRRGGYFCLKNYLK